MKNRIRSLLLACLALSMAPAAVAQFQSWEGDSVLRDPEWQKRFLGSYGFLSGAEPSVQPGELELLREVIDLLKVNPRAAAARLQGEVGPESSAALDFILANLEFQSGELEPATAHYDSALAKFPDFRRAHKNFGLLLVQQGQYPKAAEHLSRAVELGDRDGRNYGLLGFCYLQQNQNLAAEAAYRNAILQQPATRDWKLGLARALLAMERQTDAISLFEALLQESPEDASLWLLQANAYLGLERPLEAAVNLEAVRMLGKADPKSLSLLGDIYMNASMPELAKSAYLEAIEKDENGGGFDTAARAAELLIRSRAYPEASELLASIQKRYSRLESDDELRILTLKARLARADGRESEGAKLLESIVRRDGTRGDALLELAAYHHSRGDDERALLLVERAQRLEKYEYRALLDHAKYRVATRDYSEAAALLRQALQIEREPRVERFLARVEDAIRR